MNIEALKKDVIDAITVICECNEEPYLTAYAYYAEDAYNSAILLGYLVGKGYSDTLEGVGEVFKNFMQSVNTEEIWDQVEYNLYKLKGGKVS